MIKLKPGFLLAVFLIVAACSDNKITEKGFQVSSPEDIEDNGQADGLYKDSIILTTKPGNVLLTGIPRYRLTPTYKINYDKKGKAFTGSNYFHRNYTELGASGGNQWNYHFMPGLDAVYGYNMINVSIYDIESAGQQSFFKDPVLIKTLYYPAYLSDTLNYKLVERNYYFCSVYDEDTNKDGFINTKDLRRFYLYDLDGNKQKALVPENYSVYKSEYDPANDFMLVFAQLDENENGRRDDEEASHIYWIDLADPSSSGKLY